MTLEGVIEPGDAARLKAFRESGVSFARLVCLDSPGGSWLEALKLVEYFHINNIATAVGPGARCESACAIAFLGGSERHFTVEPTPARFLDVNGRLGFHAPYIEVKGGQYTRESVLAAYDTAMAAVSQLTAWADRLRLPNDFLVTVFATGPDEMYRVDRVGQALDLSIRLSGYTMPATLDRGTIERACSTVSPLFREGIADNNAGHMIDEVFTLPETGRFGAPIGAAVASTTVELIEAWHACVVKLDSEPGTRIGTVLSPVNMTGMRAFVDEDGFKDVVHNADSAERVEPTRDEISAGIYPLPDPWYDDYVVPREVAFDPKARITELGRSLHARSMAAAPALSGVPATVSAGDFRRGGWCHVVVASRKTIPEVREYVRAQLAGFETVRVLKSVNGWYAITVAHIERAPADEFIRTSVARGNIAPDSFCAEGGRFVREVDWRG